MSETGFNHTPRDLKLSKLRKLHNLKEKKLIAGNKQFLALIGHDIKNQMSSVVSFLSLLKEEVYELDRTNLEQDINFLMKSAEKTFFLLDSMLEWAFSENYIKTFQPVPIEFKEILHEETDNLELFASLKQVRIISQVNSIEKILADKNMVKSILRNLLNNAIKYSHNLGEIIIDTQRAETFLEISVKDFGVGIDSDMINIISGTNQRFSTKGTNGEAGTGFGLLLCKEFVNIHKGKMWIISKPGEGSEVKFTLPLIIDN